MIYTQVQDSLKAAFAGYTIWQAGTLPTHYSLTDQARSCYDALVEVFSEKLDFKTKHQAVDAVFENHPDFAPIQQLCFDLLLINFFETDAKDYGDDYLDSPEWEQIENDTIDSGTELLNLFLYLQECDEEDMGPELEDYLQNSLLIEEEEFQDELEIYSDVVANEMLVDSTYAEIAKTAKTLDPEAPLSDLFYVIMGFFAEPEPELTDASDYVIQAPNKAFDTAAYFALLAYHYGLDEMPVAIN